MTERLRSRLGNATLFPLLLLVLVSPARGADPVKIRVASKSFTESVILGEVLAQLARDAGNEAEHKRDLGGTPVLFQALTRNLIDAYPEYTGTLRGTLLVDEGLRNDEELRQHLRGLGIEMARPLGFNNTYALGMLESRAAALGITKISDLVEHPSLQFGFSDEFVDRADGWPALVRTYRLPQPDPRTLLHTLAYQGLIAGDLDLIDLYATDAEIERYDLRVLEDDRQCFPRYDAVVLYRTELIERAPRFVEAIDRLSGAIDETRMTKLNLSAVVDGVPESTVAANFLRENYEIRTTPLGSSAWGELRRLTIEHLLLVGISMAAAIAVALPLGIVAGKFSRFGQVVLAGCGILQTIPSLALLVFMIPLFGIGERPAIAALFLYALLPIVRNTAIGLATIDRGLTESAEVLGLPARSRLWKIELPLALPAILAGVKTSLVINVGTATLAALIGAGGYGEPIFRGIRLDSMQIVLTGAIPAAILAVLAQGAFEIAERLFLPRGLRHQG